MGVQGFLERLAQQVLTAFRVGDMPVDGQHQVVGHQGVRRREEPQIALDDDALVLGQTVGAFPQCNVRVHVDFLRHPVIGAGIQVFLPSPAVLEWHELIEVRTAIDDLFVVDLDTPGADFDIFQAGRALMSRGQGHDRVRLFQWEGRFRDFDGLHCKRRWGRGAGLG